MSLLLDALKRAEAAKQQHAAEIRDQPPPAPEQVRADDTISASAAAKPPLMTRDRLPEIDSEPLEILSDDFSSTRSPRVDRVPADAAPASAPPQEYFLTPGLQARESPRESAPDEGNLADARGAARQMFEAKGLDYDPYRFVKVVGGLAVVVLLAYGGYVYYQLQPRSLSVAANAPAPTVATAPPPAPAPRPEPAASGPLQPSPAPALGASALVPASPAPIAAAGSPPDNPLRSPPAPPVVPSAPRNTLIVAAPTPGIAKPPVPVADSGRARPESVKPATRAAAVRLPPAPSPAQATQSAPMARGESALDRAYAAYQAGELPAARQGYQQVLAAEPFNRDALLGLAALDMRAQNYRAAEARYVKLLELDPRDAYAQAGLMTLRGPGDPVQSESRLKNLLAAQPDADFLHFTLGNQYAAQSRWPEAQAAFFKAFSAQPDHPDYAFNLAVSLDHLRQGRLALEYYQKALAAAASRPAAFDKTQVETRLRELAR